MNHKTKHILVLSPLYPPHVGGLESHAAQWNREMAAKGYRITVWTPHITPGVAFDEKTKQNIHILRFPAFELISNYPFPKFWHPRLWSQWQQVRTSEADAIISRTRFFFTSLIALAAARRLRIPWIHIEHGSDFVHLHNRVFRMIAKIYDQVFGALVLRSATIVIANSKASAAFVRKLSGRTPNTIIYRGVDAEKISVLKPVPTPTVPAILYVGRLIDGKGVHDLIAALNGLQATSWQTWIIGSGPQLQNLRQQANRHGIQDRVHFFGELSWEKVISNMKAATVIVNPSYTEGLPTTIIEAAVAGTAAIATNVGGTSEIITHAQNGILVPPGDVNALARALMQLLNQPQLRKRYARAARQSVNQRFTWTQTAEEYVSVLQSLMTIGNS